jgi:adenylylsulfate kinase
MKIAKRILIMGLPCAGKTTLAQFVLETLQNAGRSVAWLNADIVRERYNDWDFSTAGRVRQSLRMRELADANSTDYVICDFVCPLPEMRTNFAADVTVWVDTISQGRFADTNAVFEPPTQYDFRITEKAGAKWGAFVGQSIIDQETGHAHNQ